VFSYTGGDKRSCSATGTAVVTPLDTPFYRCKRIEVGLLRLDLLHPLISGNKWFKLLPLMQRLQAGERPRIISFGGVWSNHLHALAYVGKKFGIETLGMVRGHASQPKTEMLLDAQGWGMRLVYLDRERYRMKESREFLLELARDYPGWELLPEGGSSADAVLGCREIWRSLADTDWSEPDFLACAVGTGGTLAGLVAGKPSGTRVLGVPVLGLEEGERRVQDLLARARIADPGGWSLDHQGAFGGYGKLPPELAAVLVDFERGAEVALDPVYTLKLLAAVNRNIVRGGIPPGSRVLLLHSGGLQGRRGMAGRIASGASAFVGPLLV